MANGASLRIESIAAQFTANRVLVGLIVCCAAYEVGFALGLGSTTWFSLFSLQDWFSVSIAVVLTLLVLISAFSFFLLAAEYGWLSYDPNSRYLNFVPWISGALLLPTMFSPNSMFAMKLAAISIAIMTISSMCDLAQQVAEGFIEVRPTVTLSLAVLMILAGVGIYSTRDKAVECTIVGSDGHFDKGSYLRSIGQGHLFRINGETVFMPNDKINEIRCPSRGSRKN